MYLKTNMTINIGMIKEMYEAMIARLVVCMDVTSRDVTPNPPTPTTYLTYTMKP